MFLFTPGCCCETVGCICGDRDKISIDWDAVDSTNPDDAVADLTNVTWTGTCSDCTTELAKIWSIPWSTDFSNCVWRAAHLDWSCASQLCVECWVYSDLVRVYIDVVLNTLCDFPGSTTSGGYGRWQKTIDFDGSDSINVCGQTHVLDFFDDLTGGCDVIGTPQIELFLPEVIEP